MKFKWIYETKIFYKDRVYTTYAVYFKSKYVYSSTVKWHCIDFILRHLDKHEIEPFKALKLSKANKQLLKQLR